MFRTCLLALALLTITGCPSDEEVSLESTIPFGTVVVDGENYVVGLRQGCAMVGRCDVAALTDATWTLDPSGEITIKVSATKIEFERGGFYDGSDGVPIWNRDETGEYLAATTGIGTILIVHYPLSEAELNKIANEIGGP
ncbi:hypothetical protein HOI18_03985 [Candidatus Uhrbacteria bacterium]|jgi:hypothetical protein|nr:hypothetical protein [Candidatus Uhrbacteria bacterium]